VRAILALAALVVMTMSVSAAPQPEQSEDTKFEAIYTKEWDWRRDQFAATEDSPDATAASRLPDVSETAQRARLAYWQDVLARLKSVETAKLSAQRKVDFEVYRFQIETLIAGQQFKTYQRPLSADTSFWGDLAGVARASFRGEKDYRNYIGQLANVPRYFAQNIDNMRAGLKRGFTLPQITLQGRDATVLSIVDAPTVEANPYYAPFLTMAVAIPAARQEKLRAAARKVIAERVVPAHRELLTFLRNEYIPGARQAIAASDLPDGAAFYKAQIREFSTLDIEPEEVHRIGLAEVAALRAEMSAVMKVVRFKGDLAAFLAFLRTDPQFYVTTPQALLDRAAWVAKMFDATVGDYFGRLPRQRFAIKPVPDDIAPFYTGGRGGPGIYLVNTYNLPSRPLFSLPALTLHESAPGHAFQMPLASENMDLPPFRRDTYISAYGEGWALYCERLGDEMGIYTTPYERFGMLSYQMWRAARLVVDTGIHTKGWSRDQARRFLQDNTALSEHEIATEVDRYIAWPGQALSYYLGEMAFWRNRHRAEQALGEKFNIRAFHDMVLALGSVPLPVLDAATDAFIVGGGKGPYPDEE
jgi:uncharacterized protein (DUF885 family)